VHRPEQFPAGDSGGDEEGVVAAYQIVGGEDSVEVVAGIQGFAAFGIVPWPQPSLDGAAEGVDGAGGDDSFLGCRRCP
jgi:hypothetical protein